MDREGIRERFERFLSLIPTLEGMPDTHRFDYTEGSKFIKVYEYSISPISPGKYSWCWIDKTNGDIRRGGWKAPDPLSKTCPPANLFEDDYGIGSCQWTGPMYVSDLKALRAKRA